MKLQASSPLQQTQIKRSNKTARIVLAVFVVVVIFFAAMYFYLSSEIRQLATAPPPPVGISQLNVALSSYGALPYSNATSIVPYVVVNYATANISQIQVNASLFSQAPPTSIYVLNWSNECYNCGGDLNAALAVQAASNDLNTYGLATPASVQLIQPAQLQNITNNSVLIVLNGLLPDVFLSNYNGEPLLTYLLSKNTTVVYVGRNFSNLISTQSVIIPAQNPPYYLATQPFQGKAQSDGYFFSTPTFEFQNGAINGPLAYENVNGGYIIAFSDYLNSWGNASQAGYDLARAVSSVFWLNTYTSGATTVQTHSITNTSGAVGLALQPYGGSATPSTLPGLVSQLSSAYGRISIIATSPTSNTVYRVIPFTPKFTLGGIISMPGTVLSQSNFTSEITVLTNSQQEIEPHIDVLALNLTTVLSQPPVFTKVISPPSYTFIQPMSVALPSGHYIAELNGFNGQHYSSAYFTVPNLSVALVYANINASTFTFSLTYATGQPYADLPVHITTNNQYSTTIMTDQSGTLIYTLPSGTSIPTGTITFNVSALSRSYYISLPYSPPIISINQKYVEFIIALLIVILEVSFIKAPARDEFYIDVPTLPKTQAANIKVRYDEILSVFDKLNNYYHWHFMPLSKGEFRVAVSNNVRYNSMPVMLTYRNIDVLLNAMSGKGYLVSADNLYAPRAWVEQSKHDIEYLATFKKLRVYLVGHGHIFTDMDKSESADIVTTLHNERAYIVIYSKSSKFQKIPVYPGSKTYVAFLNQEKLEEFKNRLYDAVSNEAESLKLRISARDVTLIDSDAPEGILT